MPTFVIQAPDGRKITLDAPDQATAMAGAQDYVSKNPASSSSPPSTTDKYQAALATVHKNEYPQMNDQQFADYAKTAFPAASLKDIAQNAQMGNFGSEVGSAIGAVGNQVRQWTGGGGPGYGQAYSDLDALEQARQAAGRDQQGAGGEAANVIGSLSTLGPGRDAVGQVAQIAQPLWKSVLQGGGIMGALGAVSGAGADPQNRAQGAVVGGGSGVAGGVAGPLIGAALGKGAQMLTSNPEVRRLSQALMSDQVAPQDIGNAVSKLGPAATIGDIGPNLQGQVAALATSPGEARNTLVNALTARQQGANSRIQQGVESVIGPAPVPSQVASNLTAAKQGLSPAYKAAIGNAAPVDVQPITDSIDNMLTTAKGPTKAALTQARGMFSVPSPNGGTVLDDSAEGLLNTRHALDGMINGEPNRDIVRVLGNVRRQVDAELTAQVPGIKAVDAKYADLAKQGEAFDQGQTLLDGGKTAVPPSDVADAIGKSTPRQNNARSAGIAASIDRIIGTNANDRIALKKILLGEGSWNRDKLALQFGSAKASKLVDLFNNEGVLANTENLALNNSKTAAVQAAQAQERGANKPPGVIRSLLNAHIGDALVGGADKLFGGAIGEARAATNGRLAKILLQQGVTPEQLLQLQNLSSKNANGAIAGSLLGRAVPQVGVPLLMPPSNQMVTQ